MYCSTRSNISCSDTSAILSGIAKDGGLFVPDDLQGIQISPEECVRLSYPELSGKIMAAFLPGLKESMPQITAVYPRKFRAEEITPLTAVGDDWALELYHGPTLAFKDVALSVLPLFITEAKKSEGIPETISILTATSGDTGKAALEGFHDVAETDITVFFPYQGVSEMQRLQMVTQAGSNVRVAAVRGNFDDCQRGVKKAFAEFGKLPKEAQGGRILSSANSINIGRLVPQVVYYYAAYRKLLSEGRILPGQEVDFVVPTGNFGDILAGYLAKKIGLPVGKLVCASNANNVLYDFLRTGVYDRRRPFCKTSSPSMDILVSSNLERLLYFSCGGDAEAVASLMGQLDTEGFYKISDAMLSEIRSLFTAYWCSEAETAETIGRLFREHSYLADTHTAVAFSALEKYKASEGKGRVCVVLSTASPFKFPNAVLSAIGGEAGADEFETALRLADLGGVACPEEISLLKSRPILHETVIDAEDIVNYSVKR